MYPSNPHVDLGSMILLLNKKLTESQPFPGDEQAMNLNLGEETPRFSLEMIQNDLAQIYDHIQGFDAHIHLSLAQSPEFPVERWYAKQCACNSELPNPWEVVQQWDTR